MPALLVMALLSAQATADPSRDALRADIAALAVRVQKAADEGRINELIPLVQKGDQLCDRLGEPFDKCSDIYLRGSLAFDAFPKAMRDEYNRKFLVIWRHRLRVTARPTWVAELPKAYFDAFQLGLEDRFDESVAILERTVRDPGFDRLTPYAKASILSLLGYHLVPPPPRDPTRSADPPSAATIVRARLMLDAALALSFGIRGEQAHAEQFRIEKSIIYFLFRIGRTEEALSRQVALYNSDVFRMTDHDRKSLAQAIAGDCALYAQWPCAYTFSRIRLRDVRMSTSDDSIAMIRELKYTARAASHVRKFEEARTLSRVAGTNISRWAKREASYGAAQQQVFGEMGDVFRITVTANWQLAQGHSNGSARRSGK